MTLTLELPAEIESRLAQRAAVEGVSVEVAAIEALSEATLSDEELHALLDERDMAELKAAPDEGPTISWEDLKAELDARNRQAQEEAA